MQKSRPSPSISRPMASELDCPRSGASLTRASTPRGSRGSASATSRDRTAHILSKPAPRRLSITVSMTVLPPNGSSSFWRPMRFDRPAPSRIASIIVSPSLRKVYRFAPQPRARGALCISTGIYIVRTKRPPRGFLSDALILPRGAFFVWFCSFMKNRRRFCLLRKRRRFAFVLRRV